MKINCNFKYGIDEDIDVLIDSILQLENGISLNGGFLPVTLHNNYNKKTIVYPFISKKEYEHALPNIKKLINRFPYISHLKENLILRKYLKNILIKQNLECNTFDIERIKNNWLTIHDRFFDNFIDIYQPIYKELNIEIIITPYGPYTSASPLKELTNKANLQVWIRSDMSGEEIAESIIQGYFWKENMKENLLWNEMEAISDYMLTKTKFKNIFPNYKGTLEITRDLKKDTVLLKNTKEFLDMIGYKRNNELSYSSDMVYFNGDLTQYSFTPSEFEVLKLLLDKKKKICTYFDIAAVIWDDPDKFSMWAMSRLISRLRYKLVKNGLSDDVIKTYRGKGFILNI